MTVHPAKTQISLGICDSLLAGTLIRINERPHEKTNKMTVHPAKTQISLGICDSLLAGTLIRINERPHEKKQQNDCAPSEDSDQPGHLPSLIRVFAVHSVGS